jgi:hypothetical protein
MALDVIYWAERALNEPYPAQQYAWIRGQYVAGLVSAALTSSALVASAVALVRYTLPNEVPRVTIAMVQAGSGVPAASSQPLVAQIAPPATEHAAQAPRTPGSTAPAVPRLSTKETKSTIAATPRSQNGVVPGPAQGRSERRPDMGPHIEAAAPVQVAAQLGNSAKPEGERPAAAATVATKASEKKPVDIAPGEKLGVQAILVDGIVLLNGRKIKTGSALPNGEMLVSTDPSKGMAETDRRVLVVTP